MNVNPFSYLIEKLKGKVNKSGDTMSGQLNIDQRNGTISGIGFSVLALGNSIASGTANNSTGIIDLYSDSGNKVRLYTVDNVSGTKFIKLPDKSGTVALTSDITKLVEFQKLDNVGSATFQVPKVDRGVFMIVNRLGILVISENTSGNIEQLTALGNITYTDNGSNSITVANGAYYRGASLVQLC